MIASPVNQQQGPLLEAYNRAFWNLGFRFKWDEQTLRDLGAIDDLHEKVRSYVREQQPHLLCSYDPNVIANMVCAEIDHPTADARMGFEAQSHT